MQLLVIDNEVKNNVLKVLQSRHHSQTDLNKKSSAKKNTEGFFTPDSFHSTSLTTWGSSWVSKEAKFIKKFNFSGFSRCFSARIEKSSKTSKIQPNCFIFGCFFEACSLLTEKEWPKPRKLNFLLL